MKVKSKFLLIIAALCLTAQAYAQTFEFADDALQRGWYDRPWQRYEAEPGLCEARGEFLLPPQPYTQDCTQAEASNLTALSLRSKGDYAEWTIDRPGRGLTIRFSIPDNSRGGGIKGNFSLSVDGQPLRDIEVSSAWAWQYTVIAHSNEKYPDNSPSPDKFARMRFDEKYVLLDQDIPSGAKLRIAKADDNDLDYSIDFVELEPVDAPTTFESIEADNKVAYDGTTPLANFISQNGGKTIFIPEGEYELSRQLFISTPGTHIIGAGIWHTRLYFSTPSDSRSTYAARGVHCNVDNVTLEAMSIDTANDKRYFQNNPSYQVGKGLNGSWGRNSRVADLRIDHFECGAWITGANALRVERCRFRNNYADGINLANNSSNCIVTRCSFRNNGDDDMASWSTGDFASDNEFSYCTAECNWRASSLGFFGGRRGHAHHIAIFDAMEAGARTVCDFDGTGFSSEGEFELHDISLRRCGAKQGTPGEQGGFWGSSAAALQIGAGWAYDLRNIHIHDVDIFDSRFDAVSIKANSGKKILNLNLHDININGVQDYRYGVFIDPAVGGNGTFHDIHSENVVDPYMSKIPAGFNFTDPTEAGVDLTLVSPASESLMFDLTGKRVSDSSRHGVFIRLDHGRSSKELIP